MVVISALRTGFAEDKALTSASFIEVAQSRLSELDELNTDIVSVAVVFLHAISDDRDEFRRRCALVFDKSSRHTILTIAATAIVQDERSADWLLDCTTSPNELDFVLQAIAKSEASEGRYPQARRVVERIHDDVRRAYTWLSIAEAERDAGLYEAALASFEQVDVDKIADEQAKKLLTPQKQREMKLLEEYRRDGRIGSPGNLLDIDYTVYLSANDFGVIGGDLAKLNGRATNEPDPRLKLGFWRSMAAHAYHAKNHEQAFLAAKNGLATAAETEEAIDSRDGARDAVVLLSIMAAIGRRQEARAALSQLGGHALVRRKKWVVDRGLYVGVVLRTLGYDEAIRFMNSDPRPFLFDIRWSDFGRYCAQDGLTQKLYEDVQVMESAENGVDAALGAAEWLARIEGLKSRKPEK